MGKGRKKSKPKHEVIQLKEWADLQSIVAEICTRLQRSNITLRDDIFFRGQSRTSDKLLPTLQRLANELSVPDDELYILENDLFFEFEAKGRSLMGPPGLSQWDELFIMRHFELPNRLMDWTETLPFALFFALSSEYRPLDPSDEPCIWFLNPYALNAKTYDEEDPEDVDLVTPKNLGWDDKKKEYCDYGEILLDKDWIDWETPIALYPTQLSDRVRAQHGWFTIHGTDNRPLERQAPEAVAQLILTARCWDQAKDFLRLSGIDHFRVYPDLPNLAKTLKNQAKLAYAKLGKPE